MGAANEKPTLALAALDLKWGEFRSNFNTIRAEYSKDGCIEWAYAIIDEYIELPASVRMDWKEAALAEITALGDNFFKGDR